MNFFDFLFFLSVVIDYRMDPKSSTGGFELIYRQVIPPAPAYLGLNLYLKGSPMLTKNGGGGVKKEKSKDSLRTKHERRMSLMTKEQHNATEQETVQAISPRTLVIDFPENSNNLPQSDRKPEQPILANGSVKSLRNRIKLPFTSNRETTKLIDAVKNLDSARRHASCGPRLTSIVAAAIDNEKCNIEENTTKLKHTSDMKCIGNKCGPENATTDSNNNQITSTRSSPRKTSLDTPRTTASLMRPRLKPLNALSKTNAIVSASNRNEKQTIPKASTLTPANIKEYRKYLTQSYLGLNKLPSKLPVNDKYYNSHFFAVGLSLRAWRSKYGRIRSNCDGQNGGGNSRMIEPKPADSTRETINNI